MRRCIKCDESARGVPCFKLFGEGTVRKIGRCKISRQLELAVFQDRIEIAAVKFGIRIEPEHSPRGIAHCLDISFGAVN